MKDITQIERIVSGLDVQKQYELAQDYIKGLGITNTFYDGFYESHIDLASQIEVFKRDYSGNPLVVFVLNLDKDKKSYEFIDDGLSEIDNPVAQPKPYDEVGPKGKTARITNFYSLKYLQEVAEKTGLKLATFQFGFTIIHLSILYSENKPVEVSQEDENQDNQGKSKDKTKFNLKKEIK
jgi:hypothetical protein